MRHLWLLITLALAFCGTVAAQQSRLVKRDDQDDPCRRFKLRIVEPGDGVDYKLRVQKAPPDIDPQMVWNPCPREEAQLAQAYPPALAPGSGEPGFTDPRYRIVPLPEGNILRRSSEVLRPGLPSAVEMMRGKR